MRRSRPGCATPYSDSRRAVGAGTVSQSVTASRCGPLPGLCSGGHSVFQNLDLPNLGKIDLDVDGDDTMRLATIGPPMTTGTFQRDGIVGGDWRASARQTPDRV